MHWSFPQRERVSGATSHSRSFSFSRHHPGTGLALCKSWFRTGQSSDLALWAGPPGLLGTKIYTFTQMRKTSGLYTHMHPYHGHSLKSSFLRKWSTIDLLTPHWPDQQELLGKRIAKNNSPGSRWQCTKLKFYLQRREKRRQEQLVLLS